MGYQTVIDYDPLDLPSNMKSDNYLNERSRELKMRVQTVNGICREKKNVLYVSIHVNAIGKDGVSYLQDACSTLQCLSDFKHDSHCRNRNTGSRS